MVEDAIIPTLLDHLTKRLNQIESRHRYLSFLIDKRLANEKLLQLEVMNIISSMATTVDYLPEKPYNSDGKEKCDFWFKTTEGECWLEIKTRPTNYRKPGHAKAITNGVDGVIEDANRLQKIKSPNCRKFVMFAFYPIYEDSHEFFNKHLPRISKAVGKEVKKPQISVSAGNAHFDLFLVEL